MAENDCDCPTCQQEKYWDQNELDAQRYRKLKAACDTDDLSYLELLYARLSVDFDSAVDALPEPGQKGGE